jgi:protoporphyrin/coproporphyrin ferrochelatase
VPGRPPKLTGTREEIVRRRLADDPTGAAHLASTAHSIPAAMAANCAYAAQLTETGRPVAEAVGVGRWQLVYQSRSGRPTDPWLGPDIVDHLRELKGRGVAGVVVDPIGFLSDHVEVLYDLDDEARRACEAIGLSMARAGTVGTHPRFVAMLGELVEERVRGTPERRALGRYGPVHDACPDDCCPPPARPTRPAEGRRAGGESASPPRPG